MRVLMFKKYIQLQSGGRISQALPKFTNNYCEHRHHMFFHHRHLTFYSHKNVLGYHAWIRTGQVDRDFGH